MQGVVSFVRSIVNFVKLLIRYRIVIATVLVIIIASLLGFPVLGCFKRTLKLVARCLKCHKCWNNDSGPSKEPNETMYRREKAREINRHNSALEMYELKASKTHNTLIALERQIFYSPSDWRKTSGCFRRQK